MTIIIKSTWNREEEKKKQVQPNGATKNLATGVSSTSITDKTGTWTIADNRCANSKNTATAAVKTTATRQQRQQQQQQRQRQ
jgi:hypothetical protein